MSFLIKEQLHAPEGSDMFTLSETAPLLPVINKKTAEINDFNGLSGAYGTWTYGLLNAIQARSQLRQCPKRMLVYQKQNKAFAVRYFKGRLNLP